MGKVRREGASAIDYGHEKVDGGKTVDPLPDRAVEAVQQLNACKPVLGRKAFNLMIAVVGQGMEIKDIVESQRDRKQSGITLRTA